MPVVYCFLPLVEVVVVRGLPVLAACVAVLGAGSTHAQATPDLEVDVLDAGELPAQALQRMEEAARKAGAARRVTPDAPSVGAFIPDDGLGTRGLALPEPPGDLNGGAPLLPGAAHLLDSHGDKDKNDKDKDHGKGPGGH